MNSEKRGILIIVNNIHFRNKYRKRNGAETDRDNLVHVFRQMGFFICVQEDLTKYVSAFVRNSVKLFITIIYAYLFCRNFWTF